MPKETSVKIAWHEPNYMSTLSATSLIFWNNICYRTIFQHYQQHLLYFRTIFATARFMPEISVKIAWHKPNDMPTLSATPLIVLRRLCKIIFFTASMLSTIVDVIDIFSAFLKPVIPQLIHAYNILKYCLARAKWYANIISNISNILEQYLLPPVLCPRKHP